MTVSEHDPRLQYSGPGSGPFTTPIFDLEADLTVIKTDANGADTTLTLTTDYTLAGVGGNGVADNLTLVSALVSGETLTIIDDPAVTQTADYTANDPFPAATHERALDRMALILTRFKDLIDRCFQLPDSDADPASPPSFSLADNPSKYIAVNSGGTALEGVTPTAVDLTLTGTQADGAIIEGASASTAAWTKGRRWIKGADVASASALTLGTDGNAFDITGTTTITSIGTLGVGSIVLLQFDGALQLNHHATDLVLPNAANITTSAGDTAIFHEYAAGDWRLVGGSLIAAADLTGSENTWSKTQTFTKGSDVASASSLTLGDGNYFDVTGTTTVTAIATKGVGTWIKLHFDAALTLTHHATDLILPGGANITTAAGDEAEFVEYASGDWRCVSYVKADGTAVVSAGGGVVVQSVYNSTSAAASTTTVIPNDDTIPQNTEGAELITQAITPTDSSNTLEITVAVNIDASTAALVSVALFQDSTAGALAAAGGSTSGAGAPNVATFTHRMTAGTTSATTFKVRFGPSGATAYVNANGSGTRRYGGVGVSSILIKELSG